MTPEQCAHIDGKHQIAEHQKQAKAETLLRELGELL